MKHSRRAGVLLLLASLVASDDATQRQLGNKLPGGLRTSGKAHHSDHIGGAAAAGGATKSTPRSGGPQPRSGVAGGAGANIKPNAGANNKKKKPSKLPPGIWTGPNAPLVCEEFIRGQ